MKQFNLKSYENQEESTEKYWQRPLTLSSRTENLKQKLNSIKANSK